jgi:glyoxylase-like metal-dependent hydrolase (beta-lactamase superfamily II)/lambda repressor-like predicted transcriptional regulator
MPLEDHYGDIIQKARAGAGWSVEELARRAGMAAGRINTLESGASRPSADELTKLAAALGLEPSRLLAIAQERWAPRPIPPSGTVISVAGSLGGYAVNSYLFCDPGSREAAAVDTANAPEKVLAAARAAGVTLTTILLTHTHPDHVGGVDRLQAASGARLVAHPLDQPALGALWKAERDLPAAEEATIPIGRATVQIRWVEGHTHSGVCYLGDGVVFVGDCLFAGSVGRARSPADYRRLLEGIRTKLFTLPGETIIYPGHGPLTTVGEEWEHNPFFGVSL